MKYIYEGQRRKILTDVIILLSFVFWKTSNNAGQESFKKEAWYQMSRRKWMWTWKCELEISKFNNFFYHLYTSTKKLRLNDFRGI